MKIAAIVIAAIVSFVVLAGAQPVAAAPRITVYACRGVEIKDLGYSGRRADPIGCARSFPASTPYVILYVRLEDVESDFTFVWELTDPAGEVFDRYEYRESPRPGFRWNYSIWQVLPIAATPEEILEQNPTFRGRIVEVGAVPISKKPGAWRLKVATRPGMTVTQQFTIEP